MPPPTLPPRPRRRRQPTQYEAQLATVMALAPPSVRQALFMRNVLLTVAGMTPEQTQKAIAAHLRPRAMSVVYPGPAEDVSPIVPLARHYGYTHFVYVDAAPNGQDIYGVNTVVELEKTVTRVLAAMKIAVKRAIHDPHSSRIVWLLRYGRTPLVLEYYYNTFFDMALTKSGKAQRAVMMRTFAKVTGLYASPAGTVGMRGWYDRKIFPKIKFVLDPFQHVWKVPVLTRYFLPKDMRNGGVKLWMGSQAFQNDLAKYQDIRDSVEHPYPEGDGPMFGPSNKVRAGLPLFRKSHARNGNRSEAMTMKFYKRGGLIPFLSKTSQL